MFVIRRKKLMYSVSFVLVFSGLYLCYVDVINDGRGYRHFKDLEFGTNLTVIVAPYGIYTRKYVGAEYIAQADMTYCGWDNFVSLAHKWNNTVYWEGYEGSLFWIVDVNSTSPNFGYTLIYDTWRWW